MPFGSPLSRLRLSRSRRLRSPRRWSAVTAAAVVAASLVAPSAASAAPTVDRISGADRFETAAKISQESFSPGVERVFVATGTNFPDALASGPAAAKASSPVLLVTRDELPAATRTEIQRLTPKGIVVLGGPAAVSEAVASELEALTTGEVERLQGNSRYGTAAAVSRATFDPGAPVAYVATGRDFPDALVGGPAATVADGPLLLVDREQIPGDTATELRRLTPGRIVVLGGANAVSEKVRQDLEGFTTGAVSRLEGANRFDTAAAIAASAFPGQESTVYLASGEKFPDALTGAPIAGRDGVPVLPVTSTCVPSSVKSQIDRLAPDRIVILGGRASVGEAVERLVICGRDVSTVATGLQAPWDVVFTPDGRTFLTERDTGNVSERRSDGSFQTIRAVAVDNDGEGGLLGMAVSPNWSTDGYLYLFFTTSNDNRVVRFRPDRPGDGLEVILGGIPDATFHNAGRIAFGPDGMLYIGTGDAGDTANSQDGGSLAGKILRLTPDGGVPADNPFGASSPVYALGFRDPQGLAWDGQDRLYATEFGPDRDDEINRVVPGGNYGWPTVTGAANDARFIDPIVVRQPAAASWSGAGILVDGAIPEWEGDLFVAALRGQRLYRVDLDPSNGNVAGVEELFVGEYGRLRQVTQAPDGSLWILTNNRDGRGTPRTGDDRVIRIGPPTS